MKMARLSLHHLTAMDVDARQLVGLASKSGCENVCLFTYMPKAFRNKYPLVSREDLKPLAADMKRLSIGCLSLEVFPLTEDCDFVGMEEGLAAGAELGASYATVHSHLSDISQARDALARLCDIAAKHGITLGVEFNPFSKLTTLKQALDLIEPLGGDNIGLVLDTLHAARSGTQPADIAKAQNNIRFVQISDGPATIEQAERWKEAMYSRLAPGAGDLPLVNMLAGFQSDLPVSIEVPQTIKSPYATDAKARVISAVEGCIKTLQAAGWCCQSKVADQSRRC